MAGAVLSTVVFAVLTHRENSTLMLWRDAGLYPLVFGLAAVAAGLRAARRGPVLPWAALAAGLAASTAANVYYTLVLAPMATPPYPSWSDAGYLVFFPCVYVTVLALLRQRMPRWHASLGLDGALAATVAAAGCAGFVLAPVLDISGDRPAVAITNLAYPIGDLLLLAVLTAGSLVIGGRFDLELALVLLGLTFMSIGDFVYTVVDTAGTYTEGGYLDLTWLVGVCLLAAAATARSRCGSAEGRQDRQPTTVTSSPSAGVPEHAWQSDAFGAWWRLLTMPAVGTLSALALLSPPVAGVINAPARWLAIAALLVASLRTALTYRDLYALQDARRQAHTDDLTGLTNRRGFMAAAQMQLSSDTRPTALLLLDLDGFKEVNDSLGHSAGDALLVVIAGRLARALAPPNVPGSCALGRLGGDEFAVLVTGADTHMAEAAAQLLRNSLLEPLTIDGVKVHVTGSVGVAVAGDPSHSSADGLQRDASHLLRRADIAMYRAKTTRTGVAVDAGDPDDDSESRLERIAALREGLQHGQFVLHYQPKIQLGSGDVTGVEALVRWNHPQQGLVAPGSFLPLVESAGLMPELTRQVLEQAIAQAGFWQAVGLDLTVAVNLPSSVVVDEDLPEKIRSILEAHGVAPERLQIEITEETLLSDRQRARQVLAALRTRGVRVAIDDYGVGYSSLAYLRELPVDELKLDRSFVAPMTQDPRAAAIVRSTVDLAHSLGLHIVAEGVEHLEAAQALADFGCDSAQGFHFARPLTAADLTVWLRARQSNVVAR
ncbi:bifunctional diguanylate cyclase/phosphodiesterase [Kineosporia sp. R_H_3]|uniref:putative bifunctional diguanylate cyclase/phosphodiesterase n=1 Tax=Kineosporia sp. R_H_3 TaxID=1961848 RepID=UPI0013046EC1|nr:bifunctional diguanylate cyclase/phosphodiesterase [Kineosporia sp. R_H_3]